MKTVYQLCRRQEPKPTEQRYGIEVEVEGVKGWGAELLLDFWKVTEDGSLRNNGVEFVSRPVTLAESREAVRLLWTDFDRYRYASNARTGIHLHVDMLMRTVEELRRILVAYICLEPILMAYCGADREQNIYCVPFYRAPDDLEIIRRLLDNPRSNTLANLRRTCKYSALYTEPLHRFGTIEFRGPPTWENPAKLLDLIATFDNLVDVACGYSSEADILDKFDDAPLETALEFAPLLVKPEHEELFYTMDSISIAEKLVRTKLTEADWTFSVLPAEPLVRREERRMRGVVSRHRVGVPPDVIERFAIEIEGDD